MNEALSFAVEWERLDFGLPEERATFAALGIHAGDVWLTEAEDTFVGRIRQQVHVSAYLLAEWFAWNWWRLRWEPRRPKSGAEQEGLEWAMAHRLGTVGGGYVWPDITIVSDGERVILLPKATEARDSEPLRYICQIPIIVPAASFESAVDLFLNQVQGQLLSEGLSDTNFEKIWDQVRAERADPETARWRKLEALLGYEPDDADEAEIERLIAESDKLGEGGVQELAAARLIEHAPMIAEVAGRFGTPTKPRDAARLGKDDYRSLPRGVAAWKRGVAAADALRKQERLGLGPIPNRLLSELAGVGRDAITLDDKNYPISFTLDKHPNNGSIVLRSRFETGKRFDLARLMGDRVASLSNGPFKPATRSYTYRQKLQRAFAGEFLCPFEGLLEFLGGDFSDERIQEASEYYNVSDWTVRTLLMNHNLIERGGPDDYEIYAAA